MTNKVFILDTDILSLLQRGHPLVLSRARKHASDSVYVTIITEIEQLRGRFQQLLTASTAEQLLRAQQRWRETQLDLSRRSILPVTPASAARFVELRRSSALRKLRRTDLLIASIALSQKAILVTRNTRDFQRVSGLRLEDWSK